MCKWNYSISYKTIVYITVVSLLPLLLTGCVSAPSGPAEPAETEDAQPAFMETPSAPSETAYPSPLPSEPDVFMPSAPPVSPDPAGEALIREAIGALIEIDWPEIPAVYRPDVTVFPLTSTGAVYKTHMVGEITFVDERLERIALPFEPIGYATIGGDRPLAPVMAYTLCMPGDDGGWRYALMLADGTVPRGADGGYIYLYNAGMDSAYFERIGSTVVTHYAAAEYEVGWVERFGLYDLETREELLPCEYEAIVPTGIRDWWWEPIWYAVRDGQGYLLDDKGRVVYSFGAGCDRWTIHNYYLNILDRVFYRYADRDARQNGHLESWGGYALLWTPAGRNSEILFSDREGNFRYRTECQNFHSFKDYILLVRGGGFVLLDRDLNERLFPLALEADVRLNNWVQLNDWYFDGAEVRYSVAVSLDPETYAPASYRYYASPENGTVRETTSLEMEARFTPPPEGINPIRPLPAPGSFAFVDAENNLIAETDGYFWLRGGFVILGTRVDVMVSEPAAVYSRDGKLLLDGIYGVIYEAPGPGGGLFVYTAPDRCVLLYPDGHTAPVPSAPAVEKVTYGG